MPTLEKMNRVWARFITSPIPEAFICLTGLWLVLRSPTMFTFYSEDPVHQGLVVRLALFIAQALVGLFFSLMGFVVLKDRFQKRKSMEDPSAE